ncbi:glycerophosphodiester phosphodiesterase family protein [Paenibacillus dakarensis]|uniref:glycerophosphodiester phosphodiesterase family protein n=1 Tax=Paenibacillus dakarensis TaxID=1527293 RepID=UPI0006D597CD|nr:glycerophosphodiester phosphodiesterase family protein [Paenibacillus dakarensis]
MFGKTQYRSINAMLNRKLEEKGVLIAVHRGSSGGHIIENTIPAYKAAIQQGGDMFEADVIQSTDGVLFTFHNGEEPRLLNVPDNIKTMDSATIDRMQYRNAIGNISRYKIERLHDVLAAFKGEDVLMNIDRAWDIWAELLPALDQHDMMEQILLKGPVRREHLDYLNEYPGKYMFMPIVDSEADIEIMLEYTDINLVGMELVADSETHPLFQDELIAFLKSKNLFVWANAIVLNDERVLFAKYDDNTSIIQDPALGWGRLLNKKVDVIQTDWPALLSAYRNKRLR